MVDACLNPFAEEREGHVGAAERLSFHAAGNGSWGGRYLEGCLGYEVCLERRRGPRRSDGRRGAERNSLGEVGLAGSPRSGLESWTYDEGPFPPSASSAA